MLILCGIQKEKSRYIVSVKVDRLNVNFAESRFIETAAVPNDAKIVDHTWRYVNKSGVPDRRFQ